MRLVFIKSITQYSFLTSRVAAQRKYQALESIDRPYMVAKRFSYTGSSARPATSCYTVAALGRGLPRSGCSWHTTIGCLQLRRGCHKLARAAAAEVAEQRATPLSRGAEEASKHNSSLSWPSRTSLCGTITEADVGKKVVLCGWIHRHRNMGGLVFSDLRDHTGIFQVVSQPEEFAEAAASCQRLRNEYVVQVEGTVRLRKDPNPRIPSGMLELAVEGVTLLNAVTQKLPFLPGDEGTPGEETRLRYRVLDLRRPGMVSNLRLRHKVVQAIRQFLDQQGFLDVDTPYLTGSTPEGARDYLVPSRQQPGEFYALPQSPQVFKQLLMIAGIDRYYQIARCFRDEDLRSDRQPEFTQLDMEMSFMDSDAIMALAENLVAAIFEKALGVRIEQPFQRLTYTEAMEQYGCDKPDLRYSLKQTTVTEAVRNSSFRVFSSAAAGGGVVKAMQIPDGSKISNSRIKPKGDISGEAVDAGAAGLVYIRVKAGGEIDAAKPVLEGLDHQQRQDLVDLCRAEEGDLLLLAAGDAAVVNKALDRVRQYIAKDLGLVDPAVHALLWVTDFPMYEWNGEEQRLEAMHHPFTAPSADYLDGRCNAKQATAIAYDLVYNGSEVGGGSLRIHKSEVQQRIFRDIGMSPEEACSKFGFLLDALEIGAPPHGGIAFGLDRLVMVLAGAATIRDVIAFPKTTAGQCLLVGAPGPVSEAQLAELGLAVVQRPETEGAGNGKHL